MCCQRYSSAMDAAKNCDAVGVGELLAAPSSPAKDFVAKVLGQENVMK